MSDNNDNNTHKHDSTSKALRKHKVAGDCGIPDSMEIVSIGRQYRIV